MIEVILDIETIPNWIRVWMIRVLDEGSKVYELFKENNLNEIIKHCQEDIQTTKQLYKILSLYF